MAEETQTPNYDESLEYGGWESLGSDTKLEGAKPFLGVVVVDELRDNTGEYGTPKQWHLYVLAVRSETGSPFRNRCNLSRAKKGKAGLIVDSLRNVGMKFKVAAVQTQKAEKSDLVGRAAWFIIDDEALKSGSTSYPFTRAVKRATPEEETEAQGALGRYVPDPDENVEAAPEKAAFEWTPEREKLALSVLIDHKQSQVYTRARSLPAEDPDLRQAITTGAAAEHLTANGYLVTDDDGVYRQVSN